MRNCCWSTRRALLISVFGLAVGQAAASESPGAIATPAPLPAPITAAPPLPAPAQQPSPPTGGALGRIRVEAFAFSGNTLFDDTRLAAELAQFIDRPLTLDNLFEAADAVAAVYHRAGWTLATVTVPAQRVDAGHVRLEVIEGRAGQVSIEGARRYREATLARRIDSTAGDVLRTDRLAADVLRLRDMPGLDARAVLRPGAEYGETDAVLRVTEQPVNATLFVDNHGRDNVGEIRAGIGGHFNNPLRIGDQLQVMALQSQGAQLRYGSIGYSLPITRSNIRLFASYAEGRFETELRLPTVVPPGSVVFPIDGRNRVLRAGFDIPLHRAARERFDLTLAVKDVAADTDQFGLSLRGTDITLFEAGLRYAQHSSQGAHTRFGLTLSTNFRHQSRAGLLTLTEPGRAQRLRIGGDLMHRQPLGRYALTSELQWVYSPDRLVDTELFHIGGPDSVRGYPAAEARGDYGLAGGLALSRPLRIGHAVLDPRLFLDAGRAWRRQRLAGEEPVSLSSAGIGFDLHYREFASLRVDLARPLDDDRHTVSDGRDSTRLFAALHLRF